MPKRGSVKPRIGSVWVRNSNKQIYAQPDKCDLGLKIVVKSTLIGGVVTYVNIMGEPGAILLDEFHECYDLVDDL